MSASLVGSEMCIRDRVPLRSMHMPQRATRLKASRRRNSPIAHLRTLPVSYTHLTLPTICSV
eukprot:5916757-Alexandrium_andersonii.AAC.1